MAETLRTQSLRKLAGQMPVANQQAAQQLQAGRQVGLQQAVSQAPGPITKKQVQQGAAQQVTAASGIQNQVAGAGQAALLDVGRATLQEQQTGNETALDARRLQLSQESRQSESGLAALGGQIKDQLFDRQLKFERAEDGRTLFNTTQLNDWAIKKATNGEDYKNKVQKMTQIHQKKMQVMQVATNKIAEQLTFEMNKKLQDRDQDFIMKLQEAKAAAEARYQKAVNKYKNGQAQWSSGGMIVGAVVGAYFGPAGSAAGAKIGEGAGSMAHGATNKEPEREQV